MARRAIDNFPRLLFAAVTALFLTTMPPALADDYDLGFDAYEVGDYRTAVYYWSRLAEAGDAQAQNSLAYMYRNGLGVRKDDRRAFRWYSLSAAQGRVEAIYDLAIILYIILYTRIYYIRGGRRNRPRLRRGAPAV